MGSAVDQTLHPEKWESLELWGLQVLEVAVYLTFGATEWTKRSQLTQTLQSAFRGTSQTRTPLTEACFLGFRCPMTHSLPFRCQCQHSCLVFGPPKDSLHGVTRSHAGNRSWQKYWNDGKKSKQGRVSLNRIGMETFGRWGWVGEQRKVELERGKLNQILLCRFSPK